MRLIDADPLLEVINERYNMFQGSEYVGDKARRDELSQFMADITNAPTVEPPNGQDAIEPISMLNTVWGDLYFCGNCDYSVGIFNKYCSNCGRKVKWLWPIVRK